MPDAYAHITLHDREVIDRHGMYYVTFGPHAGKVVNIYTEDVLTFPRGYGLAVVLAPDLESFLQENPDLRDEVGE
jgi:hypothetical protein